MSIFDGSPEPLTYAQALVEIARVAPWRDEAHKAEVVKALQVEHGDYIVPEAETRALEVERLRRLVAEKHAQEKADAEVAELAALRAELGMTVPAEGAAGYDPATLG